MMTHGLLLALSLLAAPAAVPAPDAGPIVVTKEAASTFGTTEMTWDVSLPPDSLTDQTWLVVDGHPKPISLIAVDPSTQNSPERIYADINGDLDGQVKSILKAQELPVKQDVSVFQLNYGVTDSGNLSDSVTLRFQHIFQESAELNDDLPATAHYKIGDRITIYSAVMADSSVGDLFDTKGRVHLQPGLSPLMVHHVMIQVQFLRLDANGLAIQPPAMP